MGGEKLAQTPVFFFHSPILIFGLFLDISLWLYFKPVVSTATVLFDSVGTSVLMEVESLVQGFRGQLNKKLQELPSTLDEQKRLIR